MQVLPITRRLMRPRMDGLTAISFIFRFIVLYLGTTVLVSYTLQKLGYNVDWWVYLALFLAVLLMDKICSVSAKAIEVYLESKGFSFEVDNRYFFMYIIWTSILYLTLLLTPIHEMPYMVYFMIAPAIWFIVRAFRENVQFSLGFIKWVIAALSLFLTLYFFPYVAFFVPIVLLVVCWLFLRHIRFYRYMILALLIAMLFIVIQLLGVGVTPWTLQLLGVTAFYEMYLWSGLEELFARACIPLLGVGLSSYIFAILHVPKTLYSVATLSNLYMVIYMSIIIISIIATINMLLVMAYKESGIVGSWLTHTIYNTVVVLTIIYGVNFAIAIAITIFILGYILKRVES